MHRYPQNLGTCFLKGNDFESGVFVESSNQVDIASDQGFAPGNRTEDLQLSDSVLAAKRLKPSAYFVGMRRLSLPSLPWRNRRRQHQFQDARCAPDFVIVVERFHASIGYSDDA